jgi:hypothetical protein
LNRETKKAEVVPAATLFSNGVRNLVDGLTSPNVNVNVLRLTVQHWATTTYQDEPNYDFVTRNIPQAWWTRMYRDVLADLKEAKRLIPGDGTISDEVKTNQMAIVDIMEVYTYSVLVNTFGDVPYTDALDFNNLFPKYDDAAAIYTDLFRRLDEDIAALDPAYGSFSADNDLVYGELSSGTARTAAWLKFANSLKIRMAMTIADVDAAKAKSAVEQANAGAFMSSADDADFTYYATTPNNNPIWGDLIQSKRQDFVAGETLVDAMLALNDPRLDDYYKPNANGVYVGGRIGANNTYALFAKPGDLLEQPDLPGMLLSYDEIEFYRAEAVERGFAIPGTAAEHYHNAITASILYWGGTAAEAAAYIAQPSVNYLTAAGNWRQKIGTQKWIAMYNRPFEAWTEVRRLDYPVLPPPANPDSGYPNRLTYPTNEQTLNNANYTAAASKIGGDNVETKLFWDIY